MGLVDLVQSAAQVWVWTIAHLGADGSVQQPRLVRNSNLLRKAAYGRPRACAAYIGKAHAIVVPDSFLGESIYERAILAHEFTHALGYGEDRAYEVQAEYEKQHEQS